MKREHIEKQGIEKISSPIVLIGLMGAGKTSIGKRLADRLHLPFIDADHEIEKAAGCSIADFFEKFGESEFRLGEKRVIARLLNHKTCVLATGGGAYMALETRNLIKEKAISLWLRAELDVLDNRLSRRTGRPLLQTSNPRATLEMLIQKRYPLYAEADIIVDSLDTAIEITVSAAYSAVLDYFSEKQSGA